MADELNIPTHRWYQPRNNIALASSDFSKQYIFDSGIQKIDAFINSQPWGNPVPGLFALAEPGVWYDPSDLTTLFQDAAGTTPVTAAGQPVGLMLDKSGNGNHATQTTAASRPTYQIVGGLPCLSFDGVDDFFVTPTITPSIDKVQVFAGLRKLSDVVAATPVYYGTSATFSSNTGAFMVNTPASAGSASVALPARGTASATASQSGLPSPITVVVAGSVDIAAPLTSIKINGGPANTSTATLGTGNFLARPMFIGRQNTVNPFNGQLYGLIVRFGANLDANTISNTETWVNSKTGAY